MNQCSADDLYFGDMEDAMTLITSLLRGKGLKYLLDICCDILENPVILCEPSEEWFIYSSKFKTNVPDIQEMLVVGHIPDYYMEEHRRLETGKFSRESKAFLIEDGLFADHRRIACGINISDQLVAILTVFECNRVFSDKDYRIIDFLSSVIAQEMRRTGIPQNALYEYQLLEMLQGHPVPERQKSGWLASLQWKEFDPLRICVIYADEPQKFHVESTLRKRFGEERCCKTTRLGNYNIIVFNERFKQDCNTMLATMEDFLKDSQLQAIVSTPFYQLERIADQYCLMCDSVDLGKCILPEKAIVMYEDIFMYSLPHQAAKNGDIRRYLAPQIMQLDDYDKKYGTDYYLTMKTYLLCGKKAAAAEALGIHVNTLKYRLQKISEIVGIDFSNETNWYYLKQSIYIEDYLNKMDEHTQACGK